MTLAQPQSSETPCQRAAAPLTPYGYPEGARTATRGRAGSGAGCPECPCPGYMIPPATRGGCRIGSCGC
jgi:hypothetical protein